ncbi:hypothetical protein Cme02nite_67290 [Catellatospora methionotrophica]|uniref:Recombination endonuclease VII n=1 Tax=Catellatospora methionotrophica TaxID=121620 RepID=A0A8J3LFI1_9ACTN|nr:endonuclease domain-containing protein [Catellatospora methionotrophica]GIG18397.1 hypothetical protein Cme02nite_67290 [Catellatospora methionotrophica]
MNGRPPGRSDVPGAGRSPPRNDRRQAPHARCADRGAPDPEHVDHDHEFGNVRGILCFNCNGGLGQFKDNEQSLARAIEYLKETACQRVLVHPGVYQLVSPRRERRLSPTS